MYTQDKLLLFTTTLLLGLASSASDSTVQRASPGSNSETEQLLKQGEDALAAGRPEDAAKAFKKAGKLQHDACFPCYLGLARAQAKLGDLRGAAGSAEKALSSATDDAGRAEGRALKGGILLAMENAKNLKEAESEYRAAVQLDAGKPEYRLHLAVSLFKQSLDAEGKQEVARYLEPAPAGEYAAYARALAENPRRAREHYAPDFRVTTPQGDTLTLSKMAGKVVVLDFWATWCGPCVASVPELKDLTKKYAREQLVLISISADSDEQKWRQFIAKKEMTWDQYWDRDERIRNLYNVHAFPTYIVIDREGIIRERIVGTNPQQSVAYRLKSTLPTLISNKGKS